LSDRVGWSSQPRTGQDSKVPGKVVNLGDAGASSVMPGLLHTENSPRLSVGGHAWTSRQTDLPLPSLLFSAAVRLDLLKFFGAELARCFAAL
jgi:hypothetical protein